MTDCVMIHSTPVPEGSSLLPQQLTTRHEHKLPPFNLKNDGLWSKTTCSGQHDTRTAWIY